MNKLVKRTEPVTRRVSFQSWQARVAVDKTESFSGKDVLGSVGKFLILR
jgi:hypothetical protein